MELITNRTKKDVTRWRELHDKGYQNMTAAERAEWLTAMKGCYGYTDMNRVESAVKLLAERVSKLGYLYSPQVKTNWKRQEIPTREDMNRYFGNVRQLRSLVPVFPSTPSAPSTGDRLNYSRANDLEKILLDIDQVSEIIPKSWHYAGEVYSGEV